MAYRFEAGETIPDGIRRIVSEEVASASKELLNSKGAKRDKAIHEARKGIKKIRGAMRLMQPEFGRTYRAEIRLLRDTALALGEIRDAQAMVEVFDGLVEKYRKQIKPEASRAVRNGLLKNKRDTEQKFKLEDVLRHSASVFDGIAKRLSKWPLNTDSFKTIAPGFERRYRRGRKAMSIARKRPSAESFHEWRKRVKDHWYHVRLLESSWTEVLEAREGALKNLETWLGDDHNLVVLREKLKADPALYGGEVNVQVFLTLMDKYSRELRENSLALGARIYEQKPKLLTREMSKLWDAWQHERQQTPTPKKAAASAKTDSPKTERAA